MKLRVGVLIHIVFASALVTVAQQVYEVSPASNLVEQFKTTHDFLRQFEVAQKIVALHDKSVLRELEPWLNNDDRHLRGNAAYIFASLGEDRGFQVMTDILQDSSDRPPGQGISGVECGVSLEDLRHSNKPICWTLNRQISADRYYAAHLLCALKDSRAVPILVPLLKDSGLNYIVPWCLGNIGDKSAIPPLIDTLADTNPKMRARAIEALVALKAKQALPNLRALIPDGMSINGGLQTVGDAAKAAVEKLEAMP